ncbi:MAG TPA: heterodisulfide reductase-related iron-sulfur binding cluster [Streptosporangiaceae bacterium]|nr:heterodisulfide reductase-related iron-sulfur binding cluster [Streptosporangiaceae bacterium]
MTDPTPLDPDGRLAGVVSDCVHCGFCLPACPTYQLWGEEMDSPRGRIHLISQVLGGEPLTGAVVTHLDRCLGCMACVPACPSGVRYNELIEAARTWTEEPPARTGAPAVTTARSLRDRAVRAAVFATFPYPRRLRALTGPLRLAQRTGLDRLLRDSRTVGRLAPELQTSLRLAPRTSPGRPVVPARIPARGLRRAVVGLLTGCVQQVFFPGVNAATVRVLTAEGCDVVIPEAQGCCGALSMHCGRAAEAARFARQTITAFGRAGVDTVVVNSAGCGSAMKEYTSLLADPQAAQFSGKVRDFTEFLAELYEHGGGVRAVRREFPVMAAYHAACHLEHAQGVRDQPRELLRGIPGLTLTEPADRGMCCGSAGVYNLLQPGPATELGQRKAQALRATGARLVVSANPGCTLQIAAALAAGDEAPAVAHIAEVLDASIRGLPVTALREPAGHTPADWA